MEQAIKTSDLCARCEYEDSTKCKQRGCRNCPMVMIFKDGYAQCRCLTVAFNTPCPYFKEVQANEAD